MTIENPFIPGTLSYIFFESVKNQTEPRTAKSHFNRCGQEAGGAELANAILKRDRWLYRNVSNPKQVINLNQKIALRRKREINEKQYAGQVANTQRWLDMRKCECDL